VRFSFIGNLIAYPLYLLNRSPGRLSGSHYDWNVRAAPRLLSAKFLSPCVVACIRDGRLAYPPQRRAQRPSSSPTAAPARLQRSGVTRARHGSGGAVHAREDWRLRRALPRLGARPGAPPCLLGVQLWDMQLGDMQLGDMQLGDMQLWDMQLWDMQLGDMQLWHEICSHGAWNRG
jgi:hypothetical protein